MKVKEDTFDVGVIVGRFQVPELHDAHKELISHVCDEHDKVIIFLGLSPLPVTAENPLDFQARRQMIHEDFPDVEVAYVNDMNSDERWSKNLDEQIGHLITPMQSVVLYGGRDSFIAHYSGKHETRELEADRFLSGTEVRKQIQRSRTRNSPAFREGVVWAAGSRFPTAYTCVDVAIFNEGNDKILLGRKEHEDAYRLIGGFSDPGTDSFEADARREVHEETGLDITDPQYVGSFKVDDWRYRSESDKIKTLLFWAKRRSGTPKAADDIAEVRWFDVANLHHSDVMENHKPLVWSALLAGSSIPFDLWDSPAPGAGVRNMAIEHLVADRKDEKQ